MTRYEVAIEHPAQRDLYQILHYIAEVLKEAAIAGRIYTSIKEQVLTLGEMPLRHGVVRVQPHAALGIRRFPVENYMVFYVVDEEKHRVHVLRILYNRREWQNIL